MYGFGGFGSPEGMAEAEVAAGTMSEAEAFGSFDTPEGPGNLGGGGGGEGNLMGNYAAPTGSFQSGTPIANQIQSNNIFANAVKTAMRFSPMQQAMKFGMSMMPEQMRAPTYGTMGLPGYQGLTDNLGYDPGLAQAFGAKSGVPYGFDEAMQNVPVVGSGAHLGLATNIANIGGQNVHMGPGFMMDENNYPGYGVNPVTGEGFADPSDPYIRRRRGTEIAGMI